MRKANNSLQNKRENRATLGKVMRYLRRYSFLCVLSFLCAAGSAVLALLIPLYVGDAVDAMAAGTGIAEAIVPTLWKIGVLAVITAGLLFGMNACNNRAVYGVLRDLRGDAFRKIQSLPLSSLDRRPVGELVSVLVADADSFAEGLLLGASQLFSGVVTIAGTLILMARVNWAMMLLVALLTPVSLFAAKFITSRTHGFFRAQSHDRGELTALSEEAVAGISTIRAFGQEAAASRRFAEKNEALRQSGLKAGFYSSLTNPVTRACNSIVYAAVAFAGALLVVFAPAIPLTAAFTVGRLTSFLAYANGYTKPFNEISGVLTELQNALVCAGRLLDLIGEDGETEAAAELPRADGGVEMKDVCFSYSPDRKLIEDLSLSVRPGEHVAIVGPTGCGKTTLIHLLLRFYDVRAGSIAVDGTDVRDVTRRSLRRNIGMVLQETWLQNATVRENIALGKPDATDDEIVAAAKLSHAHAFIRRLPKGYDTVLRDGGGLSEGQKQLLCIARVMLVMPPMLILDEATSSIDTRTEMKISEAFDTLMKGKTAFIVAHRLSTVRSADVILAMKDGRVVERGTHRELLAKGGFYASLYRSQFER